MLLDIRAKEGKLQADDDRILKLSVFKKVIWSIPLGQIAQIRARKAGMMSFEVRLDTQDGNTLSMDLINDQVYKKFAAIFPDEIITIVRGEKWYHSLDARVQVVEYKDLKALNKEAQEASKFGWSIQGESSRNGSFGVGKAIVGDVILGPIGLLAGAVGNKGKHTVTYIR